MGRPKTKRPVTKPNQLVLRLSDKTIQQIKDIVASSPFPTTRVGVIESLIAERHERMKVKK